MTTPNGLDFLVNVNEGIDTIHRSPAFEECNVDDALNRTHVDARTAKAMVDTGQARSCEHCRPFPDEEAHV